MCIVSGATAGQMHFNDMNSWGRIYIRPIVTSLIQQFPNTTNYYPKVQIIGIETSIKKRYFNILSFLLSKRYKSIWNTKDSKSYKSIFISILRFSSEEVISPCPYLLGFQGTKVMWGRSEYQDRSEVPWKPR